LEGDTVATKLDSEEDPEEIVFVEATLDESSVEVVVVLVSADVLRDM